MVCRKGEAYITTFGYDLRTAEVSQELGNHNEWRYKNKLTATPTILINGYQLPDNYKIEDMRYLGDLNIN